MSSLHSALDELVVEDLAQVDTDSLKGDVMEIRAPAEILDAEWLRRLGALDHRQPTSRRGRSPSPPGWWNELA
jgi:hypothetical protein